MAAESLDLLSLMKFMPRLVLLILSFSLFTGCRGLQSEMQKSSLAAASPVVTVDGTELHLQSKLSQSPAEKGFDLTGTVKLSSAKGVFPEGVSVTGFSLKPSWKGWPGYYVMNFARQNDNWVLPGPYGNNPNFSATTRKEPGQYVIRFTWRGLGRGLGKNPEHFAAYDVGMSVTDANGKRYLLSETNVPTK